jgi:PHS family inorganic phosphate transporter-like MFS transporter
MVLIVTAAGKSTLERVKTPSACDADCQKTADIMWRIVIGFGGLPGWFALYYRLTIPETPRYTFDVVNDIEQAKADARAYLSGQIGGGHVDPIRRSQAMKTVKSQYHTEQPNWRSFIKYFGQMKYALRLVGTAGSWFFLDVAFYGLGLNSSTILSTIGFGGKDNMYQIIYDLAVGNLVLVCAGAIPGYLFTVLFVDFLGRRMLQIIGFAVLTLLFAVIGFDFFSLSHHALLGLYVLCQFFLNFGKNSASSRVLFFPAHPVLLAPQSLANIPTPRPKRNDLHRPCRGLPHPLPRHRARPLRRLRQDRRHHRPSCLRANDQARLRTAFQDAGSVA